MPKYEEPPDKILTIRSFGRERGARIEAWKYWEIVDLLKTRGVGQEEAYDAASWASGVKTKGKYTDIPNMVLSVE